MTFVQLADSAFETNIFTAQRVLCNTLRYIVAILLILFYAQHYNMMSGSQKQQQQQKPAQHTTFYKT